MRVCGEERGDAEAQRRGEDKKHRERDEPDGSVRSGTIHEGGDCRRKWDDVGLLDVREAGLEHIGNFKCGRESSVGRLRVQLADGRFEPIGNGGIDLAQRARRLIGDSAA